MTPEELSMFLESPVWESITVALENYQNDAREEIIGLDFTKDDSKIQAIRGQMKIEIVDEIFGVIDILKSEAKAGEKPE